MRTIKFRGKSIVTGEWLFGNLFQFGIQPPANVPCICTCVPTWKDAIDIYNVDENTIGQFTGLFDRNGKEIYEGDIVQHEENGKCYAIAYDHHEFCFDTNSDGFRFLNREDLLEVVGNIFDNKELLSHFCKGVTKLSDQDAKGGET